MDIFFCFGEKDSDWRNKHPDAVLAEFETCLGNKYGADSAKRGRRCVTVEFEKKNPTADEEGKVLSNDAVPAYDLDNCYEIPDRDLGKWIKTNPNIHKEKATAKNKECDGKWVPLVKMLKRWNRSAGKPISPSFLIEVMALELVDPHSPSTRAKFGVFSPPRRMASCNCRCRDARSAGLARPGRVRPPVSDQMTSDKRRGAVDALRTAEVKAARAVYLERQGKTGEALALWREIMGKYFPVS